ncbi:MULTISPECIES: type 2 isopentenyl-diphosphate Delta-isomerase [unclassified Archaeoglobus]|uniref:type 2 isopentenyl-diphosphate Delta-isomerase n=1 Tax=unclassified Archaeoglobus TaxID=2643606 RepID=UPI0025B95A1C|nr:MULTISPECIES: type 2 isopentenyl-diphosphate Delta-isomerase [unclassified Archaeoglobus]
MSTSKRKIDHIRICLEEGVESEYTGLEDVMLIHKALPEVDYSKIKTEVDFFGKKLSFPFLIASMTGGHPETKSINANLAEAVEEMGIGMGVGSQRAAIENEGLADSFTIVREKAPKAFIYANIGAPQVLEEGVEIVEKAVEMIDADAVAIHLNYLQEAIQPEGDVNAEKCVDAVREVCRDIKVPVIAKETGAGVSREVAVMLRDAGVAAIDVGGKGGTTFSGVEVYRVDDEISRAVGLDFWDWGIPTAFSIVDCRGILPLIATGGIRNGIDVAKCIVLGAEVASAALPFLRAAVEGVEAVKEIIEYFRKGLKTAMFLTGCRDTDDLKRAPVFISGWLREWIRFREGR